MPDEKQHVILPVEDKEPVLLLVPSGSKIISALPDWSGRIWLATTAGLVAVIDPASGAVKTHDLAEVVQNSFAVGDKNDVYIVSEKALYRFQAGADGSPVVRWRKVYENTGELKPGQVSAGSGTTPTLHGDGWVSITDNADPMNVVVYRRSDAREICRQPVFEKGAGSTDNSLIGAGHSIVVENNHGYTGPTATTEGARTQPGIERVDVDADGVGCRKVWHSDEISPSLVPKLSLANGLVYVYTQNPGDSDDSWFLTVLDFRTGKTVWDRFTGQGIAFNNNYAPVSIGPDGSAYVGVLGGLLLVRDKSAPCALCRDAPEDPTARKAPRQARPLHRHRTERRRHGPGTWRPRESGPPRQAHGRPRPRDPEGEEGPRPRDQEGLPPRQRESAAPMSTFDKSPNSRWRSTRTRSRARSPGSEEFTRLSTILRIHGGGEEGIGEDVTYDALDHIALRDARPGPRRSPARTRSASFSDLVGELDLFSAEPVRDVSRLYRRWAYESAALDLALRQAGSSLAEALGREARPVTFVVSLRLGEPPTLSPVSRRLDRYPGLRFKLDPTTRGQRSSSPSSSRPAPSTRSTSRASTRGPSSTSRRTRSSTGWSRRSRRPGSRIPALTTRPAGSRAARDRITWDAPIHSIEDIEALPFPPKMVNVKPSRFGSLRRC